jgi:peptide/nickel transport system ATP-binding protein
VEACRSERPPLVSLDGGRRLACTRPVPSAAAAEARSPRIAEGLLQ